MRKVILPTLLAASILTPALAFAQPMAERGAVPATAAGTLAQADHNGHKPAHPGMHGRDHGPRHHGPKHNHAMHMAQKLNALETAIGIRSDQLDAWRAYSAAMVDMATRPERSDPAAQQDNTNLIFGESMADGIIARAQKAETVKQAAEQLRQVLDEQQINKMNELTERPDRSGPRSR